MQAAELFATAMTIDEYLSRMRERREQFIENIERTKVTPEQRERFSRAPLQGFRVLVFTEDWCGDSAQFVPMLVKLAREVPGIEVRVARRDENRELAERYPRHDGYHAIPIFVFFDAEMRELGALVERPRRAAEEIAAETRRFQQANPDLPGINRNIDRMPDETRAAVKANIARWRGGQHDRWTPYMFDEIAEIITSAKASERAA